MTLIVDATPLVAAADADDPRMAEVHAVLLQEPGPLVIPAPVTAEIDYLLGDRHGRLARLAFLEDLADGRYTVVCLDRADHQIVLDLEARYADLDIGLADASVVVAAHRHRTDRILTFDQRHFRAIRPLGGFDSFRLLPADA